MRENGCTKGETGMEGDTVCMLCGCDFLWASAGRGEYNGVDSEKEDQGDNNT